MLLTPFCTKLFAILVVLSRSPSAIMTDVSPYRLTQPNRHGPAAEWPSLIKSLKNRQPTVILCGKFLGSIQSEFILPCM